MEKLKLSIKNKNRIMIFLSGIIFVMILSCLFDVYFDMNDDVMMNNILSGAYTGIPDGHNIQMLYPLSFLISIFYRIVPALPWYGFFLCGCFFVSFYFLGTRILDYLKGKYTKIIAVLFLLLFYIGLSLFEMVYIQYTVVAGILALTAAVLFITTPGNISFQQFMKKNIITLVLLLIAYNLRTEMMLLLSPFLAMAGIICWSKEKRIFSKNSFQKYFLFIGLLVAGIGLSEAGNHIAYSSKEWQEFNEFFDARTEVYDFTWYPDYKKNKDFYDSIGISNGQYLLIKNYNFGLDKRIDAGLLNQIANYQHKQMDQNNYSIMNKMKDVLSSYCYRMRNFHFTWNETSDMPYNAIVIMLYLIFILQAIYKRDKSVFYKLPSMIILRSIPWIFIIYRGRIVTRLTHPMFLLEIVILLFLLVKDYFEDNKDETLLMKSRLSSFSKSATNLLITFIVCLLLISSVMQLQNAKKQQNIREEINASNRNLMEFVKKNQNNFYYLDVYSTVGFSDKIFKNTDHNLQNFDILGGWTSKSPISRKKEEKFGIHDVQNDMVSLPTLYFIAEENSDLNWISLYYQELGKKVELEQVNMIDGSEVAKPLIVYKINQVN